MTAKASTVSQEPRTAVTPTLAAYHSTEGTQTPLAQTEFDHGFEIICSDDDVAPSVESET